MFHRIVPRVSVAHYVHPHLFQLHLNVASTFWNEGHRGTNGNKQLADSLVDPDPVGLLVLCAAEGEKHYNVGCWLRIAVRKDCAVSAVT